MRQFLAEQRRKNYDVDIYVDGVDAIAYCGTMMTPTGYKHFKKALDLPMMGHCVISDNDEDYEEGGALELAWNLLVSMAGYCSCEDYDKWFKD